MPLFSLSPKRAVIIAPHADDEVLGAGGFMACARRQGWELHVLFATVSGYPSEARGDHSQTASRLAEVEQMAALLGLAGYDVLFRGEEKHLRLDTVPQAELIAFISDAVARVRPALAVVPCRGHHHQDHRAVADACAAALRPAPDGPRPLVRGVLAYGHAAPGWGAGDHAFRPGLFVDISAEIDTKLAALAC
jgi:LmbE family N-acetylglucosaminyl deacetylase